MQRLLLRGDSRRRDGRRLLLVFFIPPPPVRRLRLWGGEEHLRGQGQPVRQVDGEEVRSEKCLGNWVFFKNWRFCSLFLKRQAGIYRAAYFSFLFWKKTFFFSAMGVINSSISIILQTFLLSTIIDSFSLASTVFRYGRRILWEFPRATAPQQVLSTSQRKIFHVF